MVTYVNIDEIVCRRILETDPQTVECVVKSHNEAGTYVLTSSSDVGDDVVAAMETAAGEEELTYISA